MVQLYALDLQPLLAGGWEDLMPQLSRWRQKKVMSLCHGADRARSAGAGWLLDYALTEAGIPRDQRAIQLRPGGKPELVRGGVHFSLSHAGPWAVCALADTPVGVDVELPRCTMATARRFFAPAEVAQVEALPERARPDALLRLWTAKEAFTKALGQGLSLGLSSFEVRLRADGADLIQRATDLPYRLEEYPLLPSRVCLCTVEPRPALRILRAK